MKPLESDKHYITEYYLRKGFVVKWNDNKIIISKRDGTIDCTIKHEGTVREFIENTDKFINNLIEKGGR